MSNRLKYLYFDIFTLFCHLDKSLEVLYHFVNALKNSIFEVIYGIQY